MHSLEEQPSRFIVQASRTLPMYELVVEAEFSAAHRLREYRGACEKLHGHNYRVELTVAAEALGPLGMAADFRVLKRLLREAVKRYDHGFLNDLAEFRTQNPTAENLARVLYEECSRRMRRGIGVQSVTVWESPRCAARYSLPANKRVTRMNTDKARINTGKRKR